MIKRIDKIMTIVLMLIIIIFSIIIGANEKGLRIIPILVLLLIEIIYLIIKRFKNNNIVLNNKLDVLVLLFFLSTLLPLIFKTYSTFQGTIEFIIKYLFIYSTYLCFRNNIKTDKQLKLILNTILITSFIILFISIDMMHMNLFNKFYEKIDIIYLNIKHLSGGFGYKNTFAIFYMICIYISIYLFNNTKNKILKIMYVLYALFAFVIIYLSMSRLVFLLTTISLIIFCIIININLIKKYLKRIIITLTVIILLFVSIFNIFCNKNDDLTFKGKKDYFLNYKFEKGKEYKFTFYSNTNNNIQIELEEQNNDLTKNRIKYSTDFKKISNGKYKSTIKYKNNNNQYRLKLTLYSDKRVTLNKLLINNKNYILKYKYIPYKVSYLISRISVTDYSLYQRFMFWNDCIKMSKKSFLIGQGGNTWKAESRAVQDYNYNIKETHSYLFELLISYGIIGLLLFTIIFIFTNYYFIKNRSNKNLPLLIGFDTLFIHSYLFDFNMSFIFIQILFYLLLSIIIKGYKDKKINIKKSKYIDYIVIIILFIIICILSIDLLYRKYDYSMFDKEYKRTHLINLIKTKEEPKVLLKETRKYIEKEPYVYQNEMYIYYLNILYNNINTYSEDELINNLDFINKNFSKYEYEKKYDFSNNYTRIKVLSRFYIYLSRNKYKNKKINIKLNNLKETIINEINTNIKLINKTNNIDDESKKKLLDNYNNLLKEFKLN